MKELGPSAAVYDGPWHYRGYHGAKSVCYLRLYQPEGDGPAIAVFTELDGNPGTSVTNRIELLAASVWEFLQRPERPPVVVEHYSDRGAHNPNTGRWQFPESFDFVEFAWKPDGSFEKPPWRRTSRQAVELLVGQPLRQLLLDIQ